MTKNEIESRICELVWVYCKFYGDNEQLFHYFLPEVGVGG